MTLAKQVPVTAIDTNNEEWALFPVPCINAKLEHVPLHNDQETGMMVLKMVYRAGFTNPWHSHFCGHGFYVLDGVLDTHQGQYGPGSWVWMPEGGVMYHVRLCCHIAFSITPLEAHPEALQSWYHGDGVQSYPYSGHALNMTDYGVQGATKDQDVTFLFVTNKKFSIHFVGDKNDPCALEMAAYEQQQTN